MNIDRTLRISEEIKKIITDMLAKGKIKNYDILNSKSLISIVKVDVVRDLSYAYCYVSVFGNDKEKVINSLIKSSGFIRREIGKKMKIFNIPEIIFKSDESIKTGVDMIQKIEEVIKEDENKKNK